MAEARDYGQRTGVFALDDQIMSDAIKLPFENAARAVERRTYLGISLFYQTPTGDDTGKVTSKVDA